jgi:hypothetical protein
LWKASYRYIAYSIRRPKNVRYQGFFGIPHPSLGSDNEPSGLMTSAKSPWGQIHAACPCWTFPQPRWLRQGRDFSHELVLAYGVHSAQHAGVCEDQRCSLRWRISSSATLYGRLHFEWAFCSSSAPTFHPGDRQETRRGMPWLEGNLGKFSHIQAEGVSKSKSVD